MARDEEEIDLLYGGEEFVRIATGYEQPLNLAPSVTSVITAGQIERMGATDLDEVLETVPGLHVSVSATGYDPIYQFRGITSEFNPQVLMLVNGIPITHVFAGNRGLAWGGMPVKNIARIEVIRGPGSALYGADAFAGVINIITKTAAEIDGLEFGGRYGTYGRGDAWALYGGSWEGFELAFAFEFHNTDGQDERIRADAQTLFDRLFATTASLAPGSVNLERETVDTRLDLAKDHWRLRLGYQMLNEGGVGVGLGQALDPNGRGDADRFNADLTYENEELLEDWGIKAQASYFHTSNRSNLVLNPPGAFGGAFPDGVLANPDVTERHYRFDLSAAYTGFNLHKFRFGAGIRYEDMYKVKDSKNYRIIDGFPPFEPAENNTAPFVKEEARTVYFGFLQDEWNFMPDWTLTAGLRFDHYSDFGSTVNPRLALVWQTSYKLTTKLLYGRAFRAPSFQEQFNINNPVALGNSNLDPETINSLELAFDYNWDQDTRAKLNLFWYEMDEILRFVSTAESTSTRAENTGKQSGYGMEFELSWHPAERWHLYGNYAYQHSRDKQINEDVGFAPTHQIYGRIDWQLLEGWNFQIQTNWVAERKRSGFDLRSEVDDYVTVDLTLLGKDIVDRWGATLSIKNLFDEDAREPSAASGLIPDDLPRAGQSLYFELRYRLD